MVAGGTTKRTFLAYFEGQRGFFSLYILVMHLWFRLKLSWPGRFELPPHIFIFSHNAVGMFIVVSGFVLGLPVARNDQHFRGGLRHFARQRARRILPVYYAALAFSIPIAIFVGPIYHPLITARQFVEASVLHVFLVHNLFNTMVWTIDAPMWSIAVEVQIYVLFALVLVPVARRFGFLPMVVIAFGIGLIPTGLGALRQEFLTYPMSETCLWYIGLFAVGYATANMIIDDRPAIVRLFDRVPWQFLALCFVAADVSVVFLTPAWAERNGMYWLIDTLLGLAVACQYLADARARKIGIVTWHERFFSYRPLIFLGTFSYSLYLVQSPIFDLIMSFGRSNWTTSSIIGLAALAFVSAFILAYGFYLVFERPFMSSYRRRGDADSLAEKSPEPAIVTPALVMPASRE